MGAELSGCRVLLTRPDEQAGGFARALRERGAEVTNLPLLRMELPEDPLPLEEALRRLGEYDWLVLTSANGVRAVFDRLPVPRPFPRICAVGPATAAAVESRGFRCDLQPATATGDAIPGALVDYGRGTAEPPLQGLRILLPQADRAGDRLARSLEELGAVVDHVVAYRTVTDTEGARRAAGWLAEGRFDAVVFASPSAVRALAEAAAATGRAPGPGLLAAAGVVCIGPVTERAVWEASAELGIRNEAVQVAQAPTPEGVADASAKLWRQLGKAGSR